MLRRPEPIKERIELTTLSIIAIQITHSTTFTLLLLLRIQRYMLRNHIATWAYDNNSGRNLDLNLFMEQTCSMEKILAENQNQQ